MRNQNIPSKGFFKQIHLLFGALLFGQLSLIVILLFIKNSTEGIIILDNMKLGQMSMIALGLGLIAYIMGKMMYEKLLQQVRGELSNKLQRFRSAIMIRYAMIEGVTLLSILLFFMSGEVICLILSIASLVYFTTLKPTKERVIKDLDLMATEQRALHDY